MDMSTGQVPTIRPANTAAPDDPNGKLNIVECSGYWLKDAQARGIQHICWDGCMFPNKTLEDPHTWNTILATMIAVREAHGWNTSPSI